MALPVLNYPDYLVYEDGRIWSNKTNKFLKPAYTRAGYASVELFGYNGRKRFLIHRLVANVYIPNPNHYPQINHKDENPKNNHVNNLEWCTARYNMNYGEGAKRRHSNIDYTKPCFSENARKNGKKSRGQFPCLRKKAHLFQHLNLRQKQAAKQESMSQTLHVLQKQHYTRADIYGNTHEGGMTY